jgi:N-methylhydantoinase A/acetophenone carboxylase
VLKAPAEQDVLAAAQALVDRGARCLVVAFANSDVNAANERVAQKTIKREYPRDYLGSVPVFLSSNISPRSGEAERINTAVINAYIHAKLTRLLYKAGEDLRRRLYRKNLFIGHNNGAVARVAKTRAIHTYNSGPAGGLLGARLIGALYGAQSLISADMGGTSFDLGYVRRGEPSYTLRPDVEGFPVNLPMLSIRAIGAGGGSIASTVDGELRVGPQSAGALPGPVCFDLGGAEPRSRGSRRRLLSGWNDEAQPGSGRRGPGGEARAAPRYFGGGSGPSRQEHRRRDHGKGDTASQRASRELG